MSDCIFCRIISGAIPADIVWSTEHCVVFLDAKPLFPGHVLIVPRQHYETLSDLPETEIAPLYGCVQKVARVMESALGAEGSFTCNNNKISQTVPHLHVHVMPRRKGDGMRGFFWPRHDYTGDSHRAEVVEKLRKALA